MARKLGFYALSIAIVMSMTHGACRAQSVLTHHMRRATQDGTAPRMGELSANQTLHLVLTYT